MLLKLREQGKTIVIVLHDISKALEISDKIVVMEKSKITFDGTVNECIESRTLERTFDATLKILKDGDETYYIFK
jgi:iron complex transport system ATP-binding protein